MATVKRRRRKNDLFAGAEATLEGKAYDAACKRVLARKTILARIMKSCVAEFRDFDVDVIADKCIDGMPQISQIPADPDATGAFIRGRGQERASTSEGSVFFDIYFDAVAPGTGEAVQLIINVEAQSNYYPGYPLVKRGVYYCARMLSAQKETVFRKSHYEKLRKVYSIWICTDVPRRRQNTITGYELAERNYVGRVCEKTGNYDLITVVMVCLGHEGSSDYNGILKLLGTLLVSASSAEEKRRILRDEFAISADKGMDEEVLSMCNLSRGVEARGIKKGRREGLTEGLDRGRREGRREGRLEGLNEGLSQGRREGRCEGLLASIRNLMESMGWGITEAMNALRIPEEERQRYINALAKE
ncbi:hypothetical protein IJT17_03525 [bacterium]|nr:hypothetical protein [bacterium]